MDTPPIQYARTADGVHIAYWTLGGGPPLLVLPGLGSSHLELELSQPLHRAQHETLAGQMQVLRYDVRNCGLSDRNVEAAGFDEQYRDMVAVIDAAGADRVAIYSRFLGTKFALRFAAEHPERTVALVLAAPDLGPGQRSVRGEPAQLLRPLMEVSWEAYVDAMLAAALGLDDPIIREGARLQKEGITPPDFRRMGRAIDEADPAVWLAAVSCPTLVLHFDSAVYGVEVARSIVGQIPGARLSIVPGASQPIHPAADAAALAFLASLGAGRTPASRSGFRTILFTDVVASTPLLAQLKDARMRAVMRDHDAVLEAVVQEHGGRVVKEIGDAFMAEFAVPSAAVACAIAMQRGIRARFADADVPIRLRIGINAGEPVEEDGDLHGASVVIAKRLESAAPENGILVSEVVKQAVAGKDFTFVDQGPLDLKGFDEPVRAWSVEWV